MRKFDFNDDSSEMFGTGRSPKQPDPLDETPTFPEHHDEGEAKPERGLKRRMIREGLQTFGTMTPQDLADYLNQQADVDGLGIQFTAQDINAVKAKLKRGSRSPGSPATTLSTDAAIKRAVELVKKIGTAKVRELCDLLDSAAE